VIVELKIPTQLLATVARGVNEDRSARSWT
jgi:hypothetical protein